MLMWFVLFSLSPCVVKEALFLSVDAEYTKPLHKSKVTTTSNLCQFSSNENHQTSAKKQVKIEKLNDPVDLTRNPQFFVRSDQTQRNSSKTFSGNSPPKYILYKRLRIDVV